MRNPLPALLLAAAVVAACGRAEAPPAVAPAPAGVPPSGAPTLAEAAAATYSGIEEAGTDVTLSGGHWEGPPFKEGTVSRPAVGLYDDLHLEGDLDDDGDDEAIVLLWSGSGGSGTRTHVAVLDRTAGGVVNVATRLLGDRVQVRHMGLDGGLIRLDILNAGPRDAACCPGELSSLTWALGGTGLEEREPAVVTGRLSLAVLEGVTWRLARFAWSEDAPAAPVVTLAYAGGRLAGNAGCNQYSATVRDADGFPGKIEVSLPAATRKACPPDDMQVEERFLRQLGTASRFGFMGGRLMLSHDGGEMLFERIDPDTTP